LFRGPNRNYRDLSEGAEPLSAWGFFWRAYVALYSNIPVLLLVNFLFPGALYVNRYSPIEMMWVEVPFALSSAVGTWLLFSRDRVGQAKVLFASLRGF
jgi:hypothetical protein